MFEQRLQHTPEIVAENSALTFFKISSADRDIFSWNSQFFCSYTYGKPVQGSTNAKLTIVGGRMKAVPLSVRTKLVTVNTMMFVDE